MVNGAPEVGANYLDWSASLASVGQFFYILLLVVLVGALAYYSTRALAGARFARNSGRRLLEIIETISVSPGVYVQLVKCGEEYFLIGVSKTGVTMLSVVNLDLTNNEAQNSSSSFGATFYRFINKDANKDQEKDARQEQKKDDD